MAKKINKKKVVKKATKKTVKKAVKKKPVAKRKLKPLPKVDPGTALHVLEINAGDENAVLPTVLGITKERSEELFSKCKLAAEKHRDIVQAMIELSKEAKHANELFFISHVTAMIAFSMRNPLMGLLGGIIMSKQDEG